MKKIDESKIMVVVKDSDIGYQTKELNNPEVRYAVRGIVFNKDGEIAVFNKQKKKEYKLPGGGILAYEEVLEALKREILEETGCLVSVDEFLGLAIEEKSLTNFKQISYVYTCSVLEDTKTMHLTAKEEAEGGNVLFVPPLKALDLINDSFNNLEGSAYDDLYRSLFMVKRDAMILSYYLNMKKDSEKVKSK